MQRPLPLPPLPTRDPPLRDHSMPPGSMARWTAMGIPWGEDGEMNDGGKPDPSFCAFPNHPDIWPEIKVGLKGFSKHDSDRARPVLSCASPPPNPLAHTYQINALTVPSSHTLLRQDWDSDGGDRSGPRDLDRASWVRRPERGVVHRRPNATRYEGRCARVCVRLCTRAWVLRALCWLIVRGCCVLCVG